MKTLANCTPREFLVQSNKIRRHAEKWLSLTRIMDIRKNLPEYTDGMSEDERRKVLTDQMKRNLNDILDSVLEEHPDETAELLGLLCFVEPDDLDNHKMTEFFGAFAEIVGNPEVISFFISLMRLGVTNISDSAKA